MNNISSSVKKIGLNAEINEMEKNVTDSNHDKYITTSEFNKFTAEISSVTLAQANLLTKNDFHTKLISLIRKANSNKTKNVLVEIELKNYKHLIEFILEAKVISKKMGHKFI